MSGTWVAAIPAPVPERAVFAPANFASANGILRPFKPLYKIAIADF
jgi:hypothetical protein